MAGASPGSSILPVLCSAKGPPARRAGAPAPGALQSPGITFQDREAGPA
ncbi:MAG: hypothetical protein MZV64_31785 [Ignavibacteriales bacterium]|nr:hypothetical protein [Ignavibacteriales bacterium]